MKKMMIMPQRMNWNKASGLVSGSSQLCVCVCVCVCTVGVYLLLGPRLFVFFLFS